MDKYTLMSRAGMWNKEVIEELHIDEANRGKVYQAAKQGSYPGTIVVIENGKVIHQEPVATPDVAPATFNVMQQKYPNARITLEDRSGKRLFVESINESQYKVAGQPVTLNKGETSDGTDWTVTFKNNVEVPLSDVLALIDPMPSGITKTNVNESQWADQVPGNDDIVWVKTKEMGSRATYTPFYRGHDIDYGGHVFGSQDEMDKFVKDYILSNQWYNKLKHEPVKPIKINEVVEDETGLMVSGRNSIDNNKIGQAIDDLGFHAEWNREGFWFLEEEQDMYDALEYILTKEFDKQKLQNYTIEGVW